MAAGEVLFVYEAIIWRRGREVRARLYYVQSCEPGYPVSRLVSIEEMPEAVGGRSRGGGLSAGSPQELEAELDLAADGG